SVVELVDLLESLDTPSLLDALSDDLRLDSVTLGCDDSLVLVEFIWVTDWFPHAPISNPTPKIELAKIVFLIICMTSYIYHYFNLNIFQLREQFFRLEKTTRPLVVI
ncbi:hypothetical protein HMPREF9520_02565, partial [Enterococcus faecalis TX1467]